MREDSPRELLARALEGADVPTIARAAGVTPTQAANAIKERPVAAVSYLRLCIALKFNPLPELPHAIPAQPSDFDHLLLGLAVKLRRGLNNQSIRVGAKAMGISPFTVSRLENGHIMSIGVVFRACKFVGVSPLGYLRSPRFGDVSLDLPHTTGRL